MREIIEFVLLCLLISSAAFANAELTHLEKLKSRYLYGLIGDDYGLLNQEDLAVNTCNVVRLTPFSSEKNMAYSYWQCFPLENAKMKCELEGYDPTIKKDIGYLVIKAENENGLQSYLARDPMAMRECKTYLLSWKQKTRKEKYVCVSGSDGGFSGVRDGHKETDWVFDKFKTRKGCEAHRSYCNLKDVSAKNCLLPMK